MSKAGRSKARVPTALLPTLLKSRIAEAIELADGDPNAVPTGRRRAASALRKKLQAENSDQTVGCLAGVVAFFVLSALGLSWFGLLAGTASVLFACGLGSRAIRRRRMFGSGADRGISQTVLDAAGKVAGFGKIERAAIDVALAPNAGPEVRAEVDRLLAEDERLRAILVGLRPVDWEPIQADLQRLRLACTEERDPIARQMLEESLKLCERRAEVASTSEGFENRIEAQRELILQTLRAAREALSQTELNAPALEPLHDRTEALTREVAALESAVQEMRAL